METVMRYIAIALISFLTSVPLYSSDKVYILVYHTFMGKNIKYDISLNEFHKQMSEFKNNKFTFVTFDDVKQGKIKGDKNICITIDDGHRTVLDAYYNVL